MTTLMTPDGLFVVRDSSPPDEITTMLPSGEFLHEVSTASGQQAARRLGGVKFATLKKGVW